jgi:hypothetical protein
MLTAAQTVRRPTVERIMMNDLEVTVKKRFWASLTYYLRIYVEEWRKHGIVGVPAEVRKLTSQIPVRSVAATATLTLVPHTIQFNCKFSRYSFPM